jgi:hypothetical protein
MLRYARGMMLILGLAAVAACQSPTTADNTGSDVTLSFTPDPAAATPSTDKTYVVKNPSKPDEIVPYSWVASFTVNMKNTSKTGATVKAMTANVQQASGGIVQVPTTGDTEHFENTFAADTNTVGANGGTANVAFTVWYRLPNGGKEAIITVSCSFLGDDGVSYSKSASVRVLP